MGAANNDFLQRLLATFSLEAEENLKSITAGLLELEKKPDAETETRLIEQVFRETHSLKGAARAVDKRDVEAVCQSIENVFSTLKRRTLSLSPALFDTLYHALDTVNTLLNTATEAPFSDTIDSLEAILTGKGSPQLTPAPIFTAPAAYPVPPPPEPTLAPYLPSPATITVSAPPILDDLPKPINLPVQQPAPTRLPSRDTVRISSARLDSLLLQAEELLSIKLTTSQHSVDLREIITMLDLWQREWNKTSLEIHRLQRSRQNCPPELVKILDFLDWNRANSEVLIDRIHTLSKAVEQEQRIAGTMVDNLLENVKKSLMLPFSTLLDTFPKMVRDLSHAQDKETTLIITGGDIEIDRRILEEIKTPLIHILRNAVDHGIEKPAIRTQYHKPEQGKILITIAQLDAGKIEVTISDDGAGINLASVKQAAINQGHISEQEAKLMSQQDVLALIYRSAVSTSSIITDLSGRGLGMSIVREKIEQLGGKIYVSTASKIGTSFQILLPITVATFRGVLVQANRYTFVIPTANVERVMRIKKEAIQQVQNRDVIQFEGRSVPMVRLADVLELPQPQPGGDRYGSDAPHIQLVVSGGVDRRKAFVVDKIINEQEVLIKKLGKQLVRVRNVSGATVLGSGKVVPILNVPDLLKSVERLEVARGNVVPVTARTNRAKKSILIAEDSITSRTLLKNIFEGAGYLVKTSVDGIEALTALKLEAFDLLVSDIEMPRMNGFDLTAKVRADPKLSTLPIILVTSLKSPEDRERGIDVGADAYMTKSSFDQTNLLAIIKRLI